MSKQVGENDVVSPLRRRTSLSDLFPLQPEKSATRKLIPSKDNEFYCELWKRGRGKTTNFFVWHERAIQITEATLNVYTYTLRKGNMKSSTSKSNSFNLVGCKAEIIESDEIDEPGGLSLFGERKECEYPFKITLNRANNNISEVSDIMNISALNQLYFRARTPELQELCVHICNLASEDHCKLICCCDILSNCKGLEDCHSKCKEKHDHCSSVCSQKHGKNWKAKFDESFRRRMAALNDAPNRKNLYFAKSRKNKVIKRCQKLMCFLLSQVRISIARRKFISSRKRSNNIRSKESEDETADAAARFLQLMWKLRKEKVRAARMYEAKCVKKIQRFYRSWREHHKKRKALSMKSMLKRHSFCLEATDDTEGSLRDKLIFDPLSKVTRKVGKTINKGLQKITKTVGVMTSFGKESQLEKELFDIKSFEQELEEQRNLEKFTWMTMALIVISIITIIFTSIRVIIIDWVLVSVYYLIRYGNISAGNYLPIFLMCGTLGALTNIFLLRGGNKPESHPSPKPSTSQSPSTNLAFHGSQDDNIQIAPLPLPLSPPPSSFFFDTVKYFIFSGVGGLIIKLFSASLYRFFWYTTFIFEICTLLSIFMMCFHRILGWGVTLYLQYLLATSFGSFNMSVESVTLHLSLDKNEIIINNYVWANTPDFTETPYFCKIKQLRVQFNMRRLLEVCGVYDLFGVKYKYPKGKYLIIEDVEIDEGDIHIERNHEHIDSLNLWSALRWYPPADQSDEQVQRDLIENMALALMYFATSNEFGRLLLNYNPVSLLYKGTKVVGSRLASAGGSLSRSATRLSKWSFGKKDSAADHSFYHTRDRNNSSAFDINSSGGSVIENLMNAESEFEAVTPLTTSIKSDKYGDGSPPQMPSTPISPTTPPTIQGPINDDDLTWAYNPQWKGWGVPYRLEIKRVTVRGIRLHAMDFITTTHISNDIASFLEINYLKMTDKELKRQMFLDEFVWALIYKLISHLLATNSLALLKIVGVAGLNQGFAGIFNLTSNVTNAAIDIAEGAVGAGVKLAGAVTYGGIGFLEKVASPFKNLCKSSKKKRSKSIY